MSLLGSAVHAITAGLVGALSPADVSCPAEWIHQGGTRTSWKELGSTLTKEEWAERRCVLVDEERRRRAPSGPPAETMAETLARLGDDNDSDDENTETVTIPVQQGYEDVAIRVTHEGEVDNEDVNCVPAFGRAARRTGTLLGQWSCESTGWGQSAAGRPAPWQHGLGLLCGGSIRAQSRPSSRP